MANNKIHVNCLRALERIEAFSKREDILYVPKEHIVVRLERLEEIWAQVLANHTKWISGKANDFEEAEELHSSAEELYLDVKCRLRSVIQEKQRQEREGNEREQDARHVEVSIQMPAQQDVKNTWGEFDGSLIKWQGFHDRFVAAIHDNAQIAPSFKFQYLRKSLTGKAAQTMGEWQLTDANYLEAWERLRQLYDKKYQTCRELFRQFVKLPSLPAQRSADQLQHMSNVTHETLRQLKAQGHPVEHWDMMIVHMLHERLDQDTARQWELQRQSETPSANEMLSFLDKQASAMEQPTTPQHVRNRAANQRFDDFVDSNASRHNSMPVTRSMDRRCQMCGEDHPLHRCKSYLELRLQARIRFVRMQRLCENCLCKWHVAESCFQAPCPRCPGRIKHNSTLCPNNELANHNGNQSNK